MTLSEVFYEAACRVSENGDPDSEDSSNDYQYSCHAVSMVVRGIFCPTNESFKYANLMTSDPVAVNNAADDLGWPSREFRTFMLLMASEAVK